MPGWDLTREPTEPLAVQHRIEVTPYDPGKDREQKRGEIATRLVLALIAIVFVSYFLLLVAVIVDWTAVSNNARSSDTVTDHLKTLGEVFLTPLVGLVGAVVGFYFGEKTTSSK